MRVRLRINDQELQALRTKLQMQGEERAAQEIPGLKPAVFCLGYSGKPDETLIVTHIMTDAGGVHAFFERNLPPYLSGASVKFEKLQAYMRQWDEYPVLTIRRIGPSPLHDHEFIGVLTVVRPY